MKSSWRLLLCALALPGCASGGDLDKQVDQLRAEITSLRATNAALTERVDALEMKGGTLTATGPAPAPEPVVEDKGPPELPVVRLTPEPESSGETAEIEDGTRVKIRSTPNGLVQEETRSDGKTSTELKKSPAAAKRPDEAPKKDAPKGKPKKDEPKPSDKKPVPSPPASGTP